MNKSVVSILIVSLILAGVVALFVIYQDDEYQWYENYYNNDDEPYSLSVLTDVLEEEDLYMELQPVSGMLSTELDSNSLYLFISDSYHLNDSAQITDLFSAVSNGTNAFICAEDVEGRTKWDYDEEYNWTSFYTWTVLDSLGIWIHDTALTQLDVKLRDSSVMKFTKLDVFYGDTIKLKPDQKYYHYFYYEDSTNYLEDPPKYNVEVLGTINGFPNLVRVEYGKGSFVFCSTPILFTNQPFVTPEGFKYVNDVLAETGNYEKIVWDKYNTRYHDDSDSQSRGGKMDTPFSFIFDRPSLRLAWYMLLILTGLFVLFYARRKQRGIPIILEKENKSVEFAKSIGLLYLQSNHHKYIIKYKMKYLLLYIKGRYKLQLKDNVGEFIQRLSDRSNVPTAKIEALINSYNKIDDKKQLSDKELIFFSNAVDDFYKICK